MLLIYLDSLHAGRLFQPKRNHMAADPRLTYPPFQRRQTLLQIQEKSKPGCDCPNSHFAQMMQTTTTTLQAKQNTPCFPGERKRKPHRPLMTTTVVNDQFFPTAHQHPTHLGIDRESVGRRAQCRAHPPLPAAAGGALLALSWKN